MQLNRIGIGLIALLPARRPGARRRPGAARRPRRGGPDHRLDRRDLGPDVALGLAWYARHQKQKAAHQDRVFQTGIRGRATVLDASSHAEVNEMPVMKLKLELDVPGSAGDGPASAR